MTARSGATVLRSSWLGHGPSGTSNTWIVHECERFASSGCHQPSSISRPVDRQRAPRSARATRDPSTSHTPPSGAPSLLSSPLALPHQYQHSLRLRSTRANTWGQSSIRVGFDCLPSHATRIDHLSPRPRRSFPSDFSFRIGQSSNFPDRESINARSHSRRSSHALLLPLSSDHLL